MSIHESGNDPEVSDLNFTFHRRKNGDVQIFHRETPATILRGDRAREFLSEIDVAGFAEAQQLMARVTGNFKRGNERMSRDHPRNRR